MESVILTPRLKLTLLNSAERESEEFAWIHSLRSNEESTFRSITGRSKTPEDTERVVHFYLTKRDEAARDYRIGYAVHELLDPSTADGGGATESAATGSTNRPSRFIGLVDMHSLTAKDLELPEDLTLPASAASTTVTTNLAYHFLPDAWGKGFGTEAVSALFDACGRAPDFFHPFSKVYVRSIVNVDNPGSQRVMAKTGMEYRGIYHWSGEPIFIAGKWRDTDSLKIYGKYLVQ